MHVVGDSSVQRGCHVRTCNSYLSLTNLSKIHHSLVNGTKAKFIKKDVAKKLMFFKLQITQRLTVIKYVLLVI